MAAVMGEGFSMHACTFLRSCPGLEDVVGSLFNVGRETACFLNCF